MPLDDKTRAFLDMLHAGGGKPLDETPVSDFRAGVVALSQQIGGTAEEVHRVVNRTIPVSGREIGVRIYSPRGATNGAGLPIVMHYHGAGFVAGNLDSHDVPARHYCRHADALVVSVDYRLAPEHKFPAAVEDCYGAFMWTHDHAAELGGDPERIAVVGDSAGGNLSAVVCQLAKSRGGPAISFQALVYPSTDFRDDAKQYASRAEYGGGEYFLSNRDIAWFQSLYLGSPDQIDDPRASPAAARDLARLPPALVVTAGFDPLRDEGKAYADRLAAAGVAVEYKCFDSTIHAFMSFSAAIPLGREGLALVANRLSKALRPVVGR
jgi:acetyl esterase/lipase